MVVAKADGVAFSASSINSLGLGSRPPLVVESSDLICSVALSTSRCRVRTTAALVLGRAPVSDSFDDHSIELLERTSLLR